MGQSFGDLLRALVDVRNRDYRSDPERVEAYVEQIGFTVQTMLEMLADKFDRT